jgi:peptide/nickel transport system permease protein
MRWLVKFAVTVLLGGIATFALVRLSPGYSADERLLDPRLSAESRALIQARRFADFGISPTFNRPISELLRERAPVTLEIMAIGIAGAWILAAALALIGGRLIAACTEAALCVPAAVIAILVFIAGGPAKIIVALVLFPRLFEFLRNLLTDAYARPHILSARAKGLTPARILLCHVVPSCKSELIALAGVSTAMAFGAAIPVETICDLPGLGQLAWKAAIARDLPVLVTLTMMVTTLVQVTS